MKWKKKQYPKSAAITATTALRSPQDRGGGAGTPTGAELVCVFFFPLSNQINHLLFLLAAGSWQGKKKKKDTFAGQLLKIRLKQAAGDHGSVPPALPGAALQPGLLFAHLGAWDRVCR